MYFKRFLKLDLHDTQAAIILGPRKTGKSSLLKKQFPSAIFYDLLKTDLRTELTLRPEKLRHKILKDKPKIVVLDEIQKCPELLDEIHWCLENTTTKFILCGSSARKLKTVASGVLGGRAKRYDFFPLTSEEIESEFSKDPLSRILNQGLIPQHFNADHPDRLLRTYVLDYLEEEIRQEAVVKNLPVFSRFLETAGLMNGELLNFENVAREAGASANTIKGYYQILVDTLFGFFLTPWEKSQTRRLIETRKFYLFDCGVVRALKEFQKIELRTSEAGRAFETFLINEIRAYQSYHENYESLFFWRTSNGLEVDLVVGRNASVAFEFKCADQIRSKDLAGLRAFNEENKPRCKLVVYNGPEQYETEDGITILPWRTFCQQLWHSKIF